MWNNGLEHDHLDFGIIQPWKGYNASAKHVMYAHSNSEYITKGNEVISRYTVGNNHNKSPLEKKALSTGAYNKTSTLQILKMSSISQ